MIQRRSELVLLTHWTYEELDRQPREDLDELLLYNKVKQQMIAEADDMKKKANRKGTNR